MTFRCHHSARPSGTRLRLALLAGMLANCKGEQPPDLCKGISPTCEGTIAVSCWTFTDCDQCDYYQRISRFNCKTEGIADHGVAWVCRVGKVNGYASSFCVDASLTPCAPHVPGDQWCDGLGNTVICSNTIDGPLVKTEAGCYTP